MPVKELGVDAAVMFSDIMLPLEGIGVDFRIEENLGPVIAKPIRGRGDADRLSEFNAARDIPFMLDAIARVKSRLKQTGTALIGFSGAPFTIASYMIEGQASREFTKTKKLMFDDTETWKILMSKLTEMISDSLCAQIEAGVDVVQLFDSWVGALTAADYEEFVAPFVAKIFKRVKSEYPNTPTIHFGTNTFHLLKPMKRAGGDVFSIDWRTPISTARKILGKSTGIQGNLEPAVLLSNDVNGFIKQRTQAVLDDNAGNGGPRFQPGTRDPTRDAGFERQVCGGLCSQEFVRKHGKEKSSNLDGVWKPGTIGGYRSVLHRRQTRKKTNARRSGKPE